MENPKTTIAGLLGVIGSLALAVGTQFQHETWGSVLMTIGATLSGSSGIGAFFARDATGKIQRKPR
jgi:hypothetical protein